MLEIFILITPLLIMFVIALQSVYLGISPMPSSRKVVKAIKPYINDHSIKSIADLGSGWGGILKQLTKANKEAKVEGFEIAWIPFFYSLLTKTRETNVIFANFALNDRRWWKYSNPVIPQRHRWSWSHLWSHRL